MKRPGLALLFAAISCLWLTLPPQTAAAADAPKAFAAKSADAVDEYTLGPGDKIRVSVFDEPDLTRQVEVGADGKISFPLVGGVPASGKTLGAFADDLSAALQTYLRRARVTAEIAEYRPFSIIGEVRSPGQYPYSADLTVIAAVARAGGFTYRAAKSKIFIRRASEASEEKYSLTDSLPVHAGDTIRVAERIF